MKNPKKKELPEISWRNIAPPYTKYAYFENVERYPFRFDADLFDMVNAWWLIEAATLVYAEESFVNIWFQRAGFDSVAYFNGKSTQCYVAENRDFAIVAFRGTEVRLRENEQDYRHIVADLLADADIRLVPSGQGGRVHKGFKNALDEIWMELVDHLNRLRGENRRLWFTGHSLGAALATLAADRYGAVQGLYTFGAPRVGDRDFQNDFFINTYRFVLGRDLICRLPPDPPFRHVGELRYIDEQGGVHDNTRLWEDKSKKIRTEARKIFNAIGHVRHGFSHLIPDEVLHHVPLFYAVHIWNHITA